jgi:hypothetical protein
MRKDFTYIFMCLWFPEDKSYRKIRQPLPENQYTVITNKSKE